jgi:hypothetical protein
MSLIIKGIAIKKLQHYQSNISLKKLRRALIVFCVIVSIYFVVSFQGTDIDDWEHFVWEYKTKNFAKFIVYALVVVAFLIAPFIVRNSVIHYLDETEKLEFPKEELFKENDHK